jgi:hypothetical protein
VVGTIARSIASLLASFEEYRQLWLLCVHLRLVTAFCVGR